MTHLPDLTDSRLGTLAVGNKARVARSFTPLTREPRKDGALMTELLRGETVWVTGQEGRFLRVVNDADRYTGFIPYNAARDVRSRERDPTHRVSVPVTQAYGAPDIKARASFRLTMGCRVTVETGSDDPTGRFVQTDVGYMVRHHIRPIGDTADPVALARPWLGLPYLWGGRTAAGIDCSAFVQLLFEAAGHALHRDSDLQWASAGQKVKDREPPERGDLAFFPGHVGLMIDDHTLCHANVTHMAVSLDPLSDVIEWVARELAEKKSDKPAFLGFRRFSLPQ